MQMGLKQVFLIAMLVLVFVNHFSGYSLSRDRRSLESGSTTIDRWVQANYPIVLNAILPGGAIAPEDFPKNARWIVTVRILPPFEAPEYRFSMTKTYDGAVVTTITTPRNGSIVSQLRMLKRKYPRVPVKQLISLVSIDKRTFTQTENPKLAQLAGQFESITISPVLPDQLTSDETGYEFWSQSLWGNRMLVSMGGPGPGADKQPHHLLQWAEAFRAACK